MESVYCRKHTFYEKRFDVACQDVTRLHKYAIVYLRQIEISSQINRGFAL